MAGVAGAHEGPRHRVAAVAIASIGVRPGTLSNKPDIENWFHLGLQKNFCVIFPAFKSG